MYCKAGHSIHLFEIFYSSKINSLVDFDVRANCGGTQYIECEFNQFIIQYTYNIQFSSFSE